jgi:uncharacterized protein (DUF3820 family)
MPRIRTIKPSLWESEKLGRLSVLARLNFIGLISLADDEGRGRGEKRFLIGHLHPYADAISETDFANSLDELEREGLVAFYTVDKARYYALPGFVAHQYINRPQASTIPSIPVDHALSGLFPVALRERSVSVNGGNGREGKGMEGKGLEWIGKLPEGFNPEEAQKLGELRMPFGEFKGVHVSSLPADRCRWLLHEWNGRKSIGEQLKRALELNIKIKEQECSRGK